jgi:hypothetical protein
VKLKVVKYWRTKRKKSKQHNKEWIIMIFNVYKILFTFGFYKRIVNKLFIYV